MKLGGTEDLSRANLTRSGGEKERPSVLRQAEVAISTDRAPWFGKPRGMPPAPCLPPLPLLRFLRASSGFHEHTAQFQRGLSLPLGIAALAPGSFARAEGPGGQKPAGKRGCETAHRPGLAKISGTIDILPQWPWVDSPKRLLAGNNEDAVAHGRGSQLLGRPIYSQPGKDNDSVAQAGNGFRPDCPILNILSRDDPHFGKPKPNTRPAAGRLPSRHTCGAGDPARCAAPPRQRTRARIHTHRLLRKLSSKKFS
ncbi:hypothetical protein A203_05495 [Chromobacterium violaceum]|uniref:hypothetical protein n=1 Tax=Chromobacterium violaceum TaxID=536 RepID=UPI003CECD2B2